MDMSLSLDNSWFSETAARKKSFTTHYYNAEIHRASQKLPNFLHAALNEKKQLLNSNEKEY